MDMYSMIEKKPLESLPMNAKYEQKEFKGPHFRAI